METSTRSRPVRPTRLMDMINPWIDSAEIRRLAESLAKPARKPATHHEEAGFDDDFEGFTGEPAMADAPLHLKPAVEMTDAPFVQTKPPVEPASVRPQIPAATQQSVSVDVSSPPSAISQAPASDRFQRFGQWMSRQHAATGIFIVDRQATVIFDQGRHDKLHFLAINVARNLQRLEATAAKVHIRMGGGAILEVIPVETPNGYLVLGAVVTQSLDPSAVAEVAAALRQAS